MYQMINEKLRIMSCGISDLSDKRKEDLVKVFNGDSIKTLSMFYDQEDDMIVLNHDHDSFEFHKIFAEEFFSLNGDGRVELRQNIYKFQSRDYLMEMVNVLDSVYWIREYKKEEDEARRIRKLLTRQSIEAYRKAVPMLEALRRIDTRESKIFFDWDPYMLGYVHGIRSERARRKKAALKKAGAL